MRRGSGIAFAVSLAAALLFLSPRPAAADDYSYARVVRISLVQGDVQVSRPDQPDWEKAIANLPIQQGFAIATTDGGRAEIEFENGATARIAENSVLQFTELALSEGGRITRLTLTQGTATFYADPANEDTFTILTPQLQVTPLDNAHFRLDVFEDGGSVSVFKGDVEVDSPAGTQRIGRGKTLAYNSADPDHVRIDNNPAADAWDRWVAQRDEALEAAREDTYQYARAPFSYGMSDLASYGDWIYLPGYGYAWQPWSFGAGGMPFYDGYWDYYPAFGWTWVSYEPWGWVPYHFGRWAYSPSFGWIWLPGYFTYWSPAPVCWVRTGNAFGWSPLPPNTPLGQAPVLTAQTPVVVSPTIRSGKKVPYEVLRPFPNPRAQVYASPPDASGKFTASAAATASAPAAGGGTSAVAAALGAPNSPAGSAAPSGAGTALVPMGPGLRGIGGSGEATPSTVYNPVEHKFVSNSGAMPRALKTPAGAPPEPAGKNPESPEGPPPKPATKPPANTAPPIEHGREGAPSRVAPPPPPRPEPHHTPPPPHPSAMSTSAGGEQIHPVQTFSLPRYSAPASASRSSGHRP